MCIDCCCPNPQLIWQCTHSITYGSACMCARVCVCVHSLVRCTHLFTHSFTRQLVCLPADTFVCACVCMCVCVRIARIHVNIGRVCVYVSEERRVWVQKEWIDEKCIPSTTIWLSTVLHCFMKCGLFILFLFEMIRTFFGIEKNVPELDRFFVVSCFFSYRRYPCTHIQTHATVPFKMCA